MSQRVHHVESKKTAFLTLRIKARDAVALKATQENRAVSHIRNQPPALRVKGNIKYYLLAMLVSW